MPAIAPADKICLPEIELGFTMPDSVEDGWLLLEVPLLLSDGNEVLEPLTPTVELLALMVIVLPPGTLASVTVLPSGKVDKPAEAYETVEPLGRTVTPEEEAGMGMMAPDVAVADADGAAVGCWPAPELCDGGAPFCPPLTEEPVPPAPWPELLPLLLPPWFSPPLSLLEGVLLPPPPLPSVGWLGLLLPAPVFPPLVFPPPLPP